MVYTESRRINEKVYYYRVVSIRRGAKIAKKRVYLGHNMSKLELQKKENAADERLLIKKIVKADKEIKKIRPKIIKILNKYHVGMAGIFGSYSRGEQKRTSDIDIVVDIKNKNMSLLGFIRLNRLLEEALKRKVDLVEYSAIKPRLKDRILKEEIRII